MSQTVIRFPQARTSHQPSAAYETRLRTLGGNELQVILKVSERCNIACTYCYFFFMGDESYKDNPALIQQSTVEQLAAFINEAVLKYDIKNVSVILHGGEPLMLKPDRMRELLATLSATSGTAPVNFSLQTNGMLINDEWIDLFEEYQVHVGISLDGPEKFNDIGRIDKKGGGSYRETRRGINLLQEAARAGRIASPGVLWVLNPDFPATEIFQHFVHEIGFRNMDILLPDANWDSFDTTQSARYRHYVDELFDLYQKNTVSGVRIRFFDQIIAAIAASAEFRTRHARNQSDRNIVLTISSKGDLAPDDILRSSDPLMMRLGLNVGDSQLQDYLLHPTTAALNALAHQAPASCADCEWKNICHGGALYHRYATQSGFDNPSVYCETLRSTYENVAAACVANGTPVDAIIQTLQAEV